MDESKTQQISFGGGCFWCTEAVFQSLDGVHSVMPGYQGGDTVNPTYQDVCTGRTGHAEVTHVTYDPAVIALDDLLDIFWQAHDPTQLNRQGADVGTQYRSVVFYYDDEQKTVIGQSLAALEASGTYQKPIVTQVEPAPEFYPAEDYHRNYYRNNKNAPYCRVVILPKLKKLGLDGKPAKP